MPAFILVRHGESESNRDSCFARSADVPLTDLGRQQARDAAAHIARYFNPERIVSSTFARARQSAEIISAALKLPLEVVDGIQERDLGALKGQPWHQHAALTAADPNYDPEREWLWRPPGGESYQDVRQRVMPVLETLRSRHAAEELVIVSHGAVMRAIWSQLTGAWISSFIPNNCALLLVPHDGQRFFPPQVISGDAAASILQQGGGL
jgi:ribonuclease H / adenosylcobalamin/alpha-ribazole phosphatase